jgi:hypothetical protein
MALPSFWATHLAKALSGDQPCLRPLWLFSRGAEKRPDDDPGRMAKWRADHSALIQKAVAVAGQQGWSTKVEQWIQVTGQCAVIKGKVDIIAQKTECRPRIVDCKGGEPSDTDVTQVLLYQKLVPLSWKSPTMQFDGAVWYGEGAAPTRTTPAQADDLWPRATALVKLLALLPMAPEPLPSQSACRFCAVRDVDCPARWTGQDEGGETVDF